MSEPRIVLSGVGHKLQGLSWESDSALRIGSHDDMDVVLHDLSIARFHAEIEHKAGAWLVRNHAAKGRPGTTLNGIPLERGECSLKAQDVLQCGGLRLQVTVLEPTESTTAPEANGAAPNGNLVSGYMRVQAATNRSWDEALQKFTFDHRPRSAGQSGMLTLVRTGHHLRHIASLDELLRSVLSEVVSALGAQRGSIVLQDEHTGQLELRSVLGPALSGPSQKCYSRTLAERVFHQGESLLSRDVRVDNDLNAARSVQLGTMSSIICALLRSPRQRLGVLQLDRGPLQSPFEEEDLYLADAIAASVAVGIESAQLVEKQREQFVQTVASLARAVEMRDQYTGDHTRRVTDYALMLAEEISLPAVERYHIQVGTPLHDIGKIGIDDAILRKPGKLTIDEFESMKSHTLKGAAILESMCSLTPMIPIVRNHHERWDGNGYPDRLAGNRIAITARVVSVADAFDAMTSDRPYRRALTSDQAYHELVHMAGSHFDPQCIGAFLRLRPKIEARMRQG